MRSSRWCFTINNPTEDDAPVHWLKKTGVQFCIFQREVGESGTPHFQGYLVVPERKYLGFMKTLSPRAHWEVAKGDFRSQLVYCSKRKERTGRDTGEGLPVIFGYSERMMQSARNYAEEIDLLFQEGPYVEVDGDHGVTPLYSESLWMYWNRKTVWVTRPGFVPCNKSCCN